MRPTGNLFKAIFTPLFFGILPIFSLYTQNRGFFGLDVLVVPVAITVVASLIMFGVFRLVTGDNRKASLVLSIFTLLFFTYGTITSHLEGIYYRFGSLEIGANKILLSVELVAMLFSIVLIVRSKRQFKKTTFFLFTCAFVAVLLAGLPVAGHLILRIIKGPVSATNFTGKSRW